MSKIKIVIADDQLLTREGLRTILDLEDDMEVVGAAKNGKRPARWWKHSNPIWYCLMSKCRS